MALKILQPGIQPLGQFSLSAGEATGMTGGECGVFEAVSGSAQIKKGFPLAGQLHGFLDEGVEGYGTMLGSVEGIGSTWVSGAVVVGPHTTLGSRKATLWTKPGLYGVTLPAWSASADFDGLELNEAVYAKATGKLTTDDDDGVQIALFVEKMADSSLVSTTAAAAGADPTVEYAALYLLGVQA
jgi:hypothetical protein